MTDDDKNGKSDEVEIAEAAAHKADAEVERAKLELEHLKLAAKQPLYDRVIMRLVIPFALAFAAPAATYYFGTRASAGLDYVERLDKTVERLERLVVEREIRSKLDALPTTTQVTPERLTAEYLKQVQQTEAVDDIDEFLKKRLTETQEQRNKQ